MERRLAASREDTCRVDGLKVTSLAGGGSATQCPRCHRLPVVGDGEQPVAVDILTLGQYLRPSDAHIALDRYVTPDEFRMFRAAGRDMGFRHVESGPLVRSSYRAGRLYRQAMDRRAEAVGTAVGS